MSFRKVPDPVLRKLFTLLNSILQYFVSAQGHSRSKLGKMKFNRKCIDAS